MIASPSIEVFFVVHVHQILAKYVRIELSKSYITSQTVLSVSHLWQCSTSFRFLQSAHVGQLSDIVCTVRTA